MTTTIIEPGVIQPSAAEAPFLRRTCRTVFGERAQRFSALAHGHAMEDFLRFMGHLAEAQQRTLDTQGQPSLPDSEQIKLCKAHGMPPLGAHTLRRDPSWREGLHSLLEQIENHANDVTRAAMLRLAALSEAELETFAEKLLNTDYAGLDLAAAPLVGAALQVYWVRLVTTLEQADFSRPEVHTLCPACGSLPGASVMRIGGAEQGLRYLHCSLCASEWNMVRVKCSHCESTKGISYYGIEGDKGAVKAEACEECGSYLKILHMDKDPNLEPTADDLASLTLDILMDESGVQRSGPNLFLVSA